MKENGLIEVINSAQCSSDKRNVQIFNFLFERNENLTKHCTEKNSIIKQFTCNVNCDVAIRECQLQH